MMTKSEFLRAFENTLSPAPDAPLTGRELCRDLEGWDSMGVLSFIAMVDKEFHLTLPVDKIFTCNTVDDLAALVGDRLEL